MIQEQDYPPGKVIETPRFTLDNSLAWLDVKSVCGVCMTVRQGVVRFYTFRSWQFICRECLTKINSALPDQNEQE